MANTINDLIKSEPLDDWSEQQDQRTNIQNHAYVSKTGEPLIEVKKEEFIQEGDTAKRQDFQTTELSQSFEGNVEELTIADVFSVSERAFNQEEGDFLIQAKSENSQDAGLNDDPELSEICGLNSQTSEQEVLELESPPKFACKYCSKCYYSYKHLIGHEKMHGNKKVFSCEYCGKGFINASKCKQHEETHKRLNCATVHVDGYDCEKDTETPFGSFQCDLCEKSYRHDKQLREHVRHVHSLPVVERPFKCSTCNKTYKRQHHLREHEIAQGHTKMGNDSDSLPDARRFKCSECEKTYTKRSSLREHSRITHSKPNQNERPFQCRYCDKNYKRKSHLREHERVHAAAIVSVKGEKRDSNQGPFQCQHCEKKYTKKSSLKEHEKVHTLSAEDLEARPYKCQLCENAYKRKSHLREHEKKHAATISPSGKNERLFQCQLCEKKYTKKSSLKEHDKVHTLSAEDLEARPYKCQLCENAYKRKSHLREHEKKHAATVSPSDKNERLFQCQLCEKNYTRKCHLAEHEKLHMLSAEGSDARPYKCRVCEKTYKRKSHLTEHMRTHLDLGTAANLRPFQCQLCQKNYKRKKHLRWHERSVHSQGENDPSVRKRKCNYCDKTFAYKYLQEHVRVIHALSKPFPCRYCEKTFVSPCRRKRHESRHSTEKPHICQFCSKAFSTKYLRRQHERIHFPKTQKTPPRKNHFCHQCGKALSSATNLKYHLKSHLGLKDHVCQYCGKCFLGRPSLARHERGHCFLRAKNYKCTMCEKDFPFQSQLHHHMFQVHSTRDEFEAKLRASVSFNDEGGVHKQVEQKKQNPTGQQYSRKKLHRCRVCEKSFEFLNLLKKHQVFHAALLKYKCDTCGRKYKTKPELARHCSHGHKEVIYPAGVDVDEQSSGNNAGPAMCSTRWNFKLALPSESEWGDNS